MLTVNAERSEPTVVAERPPTSTSTRVRNTVSDERTPVTFEQVVEQQQANVIKLVRRLLGWSADAGDVDDVVQDVFLAVLKHLHQFRGASSVSTWITRITINACRTHRRKRLLRMTFLRRWVTHGATSTRDAEPTNDERDETNRRVRQAVGGLPSRYREVIVLRYLQGMDVDAIGQVLGVSRGAIEVRLHRARALLKGELGPLMDER